MIPFTLYSDDVITLCYHFMRPFCPVNDSRQTVSKISIEVIF